MKRIKIQMLTFALFMVMVGFSQVVYAHTHHDGVCANEIGHSTLATTDENAVSLTTAEFSALIITSKSSNDGPSSVTEPGKLSSLITKDRYERSMSVAVHNLFVGMLLFDGEMGQPWCPVCQCDHNTHPAQCDTPCTEVGNHYCNVQ